MIIFPYHHHHQYHIDESPMYSSLFFFLEGSFTTVISRTTVKAKFLVIKIWSLDPQDLEQSCPESVKMGQRQKASQGLQRHSVKTKSNSGAQFPNLCELEGISDLPWVY